MLYLLLLALFPTSKALSIDFFIENIGGVGHAEVGRIFGCGGEVWGQIVIESPDTMKYVLGMYAEDTESMWYAENVMEEDRFCHTGTRVASNVCCTRDENGVRCRSAFRFDVLLTEACHNLDQYVPLEIYLAEADEACLAELATLPSDAPSHQCTRLLPNDQPSAMIYKQDRDEGREPPDEAPISLGPPNITYSVGIIGENGDVGTLESPPSLPHKWLYVNAHSERVVVPLDVEARCDEKQLIVVKEGELDPFAGRVRAAAQNKMVDIRMSRLVEVFGNGELELRATFGPRARRRLLSDGVAGTVEVITIENGNVKKTYLGDTEAEGAHGVGGTIGEDDVTDGKLITPWMFWSGGTISLFISLFVLRLLCRRCNVGNPHSVAPTRRGHSTRFPGPIASTRAWRRVAR